jgi:hypothetical protein
VVTLCNVGGDRRVIKRRKMRRGRRIKRKKKN